MARGRSSHGTIRFRPEASVRWIAAQALDHHRLRLLHDANPLGERDQYEKADRPQHHESRRHPCSPVHQQRRSVHLQDRHFRARLERGVVHRDAAPVFPVHLHPPGRDPAAIRAET